MATRDLISKRTRTEFREALCGWGTLRIIDVAFENEDFAPDLSFEPDVGGQRRALVEQYYRTIDFADPRQNFRLLKVYEGIIFDIEPQSPELAGKLRQHLERDGYRFEDGRLILRNPHARFQDLFLVAQTLDASEIAIQIERIEAALETDPDLAIGTAKELVESCCKTILAERNVPPEKTDDLPQLIKKTMKELKLLPDDIPDRAKGVGTIRKTLSNLGAIVSGLAEIRNLYGTGHGKHGKHRGLSARHAKLAAGAASTLVVFLFETHQHRGGEAE